MSLITHNDGRDHLTPESPRTPATPPNVLTLLPAKARQIAYVVFGIVGMADGSALVGYAAAGLALPVWLVVATAIIAYLTVPFSSLAATNVRPERPPT